MICKWHRCSNETRTRSEFCSDTCSKRYRRNPDKPGQEAKSDTKPGQTSHVTELSSGEVAEIMDVSVPALEVEVCGMITGLLHYTANPNMYVERNEPDKLNWGEYMDRDELKRRGFKANRVSIPGDWDYRKVG